jgi:putative redox protein
MRTERFDFPNARGETLAALLNLPDGEPAATALFAHCFTCGKDNLAASRIAERLTDAGIAVLRFDFTGLGSSAGEFANTHFSSNIGDLVAAANRLREIGRAPGILIGHSLGGAAMLAAAHDIPDARAVVTIAAPYDPSHVLNLFRDRLDEIRAQGEIEVTLAGRTIRVRREFLDDIAQHTLRDRIAGLRKALLVFHAPTDLYVGIENATKIFLAAKHPKSFISLDDADHLLTKRRDALYVADVIAAWASRYLEAPAAAPAGASVPNLVTVRETRAGKFQQDITVGRHHLTADEPVDAGGLDSGPGPYDLLLAALGACTAMTVRLYADGKRLPLDRVTVRLSHEKIYATDCAECETKDGKIDRIERAITLEGALDDAQRQRLIEIAEKCPVHRTLHSEVNVRTRLSDTP